MGGLGNQMFQYAAGRALSLHHNTELKLDITSLASGGKRKYELDCFNVKKHAKVIKGNQVSNLLNTPNRGFLHRVKKIEKTEQQFTQYFEPHFNFDISFFEKPDHSYLDGYWQSEKYFNKNKDAILEELRFKIPLKGENKKIAAIIKNNQSVGIHVRRGDYISNYQTNQFHGVLGLEYYNQAINMICERIPEPLFFLFSDDVTWAKENIISNYPINYISHGNRGFEDMHLLSLCSYHVIANSSFSWWAAWLNNNPDKIVIAPRRWFADEKMNSETEDLIPDGWIRI